MIKEQNLLEFTKICPLSLFLQVTENQEELTTLKQEKQQLEFEVCLHLLFF